MLVPLGVICMALQTLLVVVVRASASCDNGAPKTSPSRRAVGEQMLIQARVSSTGAAVHGASLRPIANLHKVCTAVVDENECETVTCCVWDAEHSICAASQECSRILAADDACLCVFDVDRTLTGKQQETHFCPRNRVIWGVHDDAYGWGTFTLSALAVEGINNTFCGECFLGVCSAGHVGGHASKERQHLVEHVLRSVPQDLLVKLVPSATTWSDGSNVRSPLVVGQPNVKKQDAVQDVREWYQQQGIFISPERVFFFGDRTENIQPFAERGFNAKEISCGSRDERLNWGTGEVGYCGATPEEITKQHGITHCVPQCQDTIGWTNGHSSCNSQGHHATVRCNLTGWTCAGYSYRHWCWEGHITRGSHYMTGPGSNYPEQNCCVCGGGTVGACNPASIRRRRRGGGSSTCSCRRRSGTENLETGWQCKDNVIQRYNDTEEDTHAGEDEDEV